MRTILGVILIGAGVAAAGSSTASAPEQPRPGQLTEARVWVENRGREQAVPVDLRGVTMDTPIRVQVVNGDVNARAPEAVLVRHARQMWEYRTITVRNGESADGDLRTPGEEGWETTGIAWTDAKGTILLLKRFR